MLMPLIESDDQGCVCVCVYVYVYVCACACACVRVYVYVGVNNVYVILTDYTLFYSEQISFCGTQTAFGLLSNDQVLTSSLLSVSLHV